MENAGPHLFWFSSQPHRSAPFDGFCHALLLGNQMNGILQDIAASF